MRRAPLVLPLALIALATTSGAQSRAVGTDFPAYGPHAVGYRLIVHEDWTRAAGLPRDFAGRPTGAAPATSLSISVWYPARSSGRPITWAQYSGVGRTGTRLPADGDSLRNTAIAPLRATGRLRYGRELSRQELATIASLAHRATLDAPPVAGRHPLVIGGLESPAVAAPWAEYLASHGYVVVSTPSQGRTPTLQATAPLVAIETQTRNLETVFAVARALPFVDAARLGVIGLNFDGYAALVFQSRNGRARAIATLDGWEGKEAGVATLASVPGFDPVRIRVPYLGFMQADPPSPALRANPAVLSQLRYAPRAMYVLPALRHDHYVGGSALFPIHSDTARASFAAAFAGLRALFDAFVRDTARASASSPAPPALPATVRTLFADARVALPSVPDAAEFESLVMSGDTVRLRDVVREAQRNDSTVQLFAQGTMNLYAFRFRQRGDSATARALLALAAEALPRTGGASTANAADVESPEAIVRATYESVSRAPAAPFQWNRMRSLFLPGARLIPNTEQTRGEFTVHTVESFIQWIDEGWRPVLGTDRDRGFAESGVHAIIEQYGDIAHVLSTYEKHWWNDPQVLGRGINSIQLVKKDGRWWITSLIWDEETGAGRVPGKYRP